MNGQRWRNSNAYRTAYAEGLEAGEAKAAARTVIIRLRDVDGRVLLCEDVIERLRGLGWCLHPIHKPAEGDATYMPPTHGWTCFHCGETFTIEVAARAHFGAQPTDTPGCMLRVQVGEERGLLMALRKAEQRERDLLRRVGELEADLEAAAGVAP